MRINGFRTGRDTIGDIGTVCVVTVVVTDGLGVAGLALPPGAQLTAAGSGRVGDAGDSVAAGDGKLVPPRSQ